MENIVDISQGHWDNTELIMRLDTDVVDRTDHLCVDLNGFQVSIYMYIYMPGSHLQSGQELYIIYNIILLDMWGCYIYVFSIFLKSN